MATEVGGEDGRPHEREDRGGLLLLDVDGRPLFDPDQQPARPSDRSRLVGALVVVAALVLGVWALGSYAGGGSRQSGLSDTPEGAGGLDPPGASEATARLFRIFR